MPATHVALRTVTASMLPGATLHGAGTLELWRTARRSLGSRRRRSANESGEHECGSFVSVIRIV